MWSAVCDEDRLHSSCRVLQAVIVCWQAVSHNIVLLLTQGLGTQHLQASGPCPTLLHFWRRSAMVSAPAPAPRLRFFLRTAAWARHILCALR